MLKRALALMCLVCLLFSFAPQTTAEESASFYAYFEDARWLRTEPKANTPTVMNVPERTMLKLTPVNDKYAHTVYKGKEGYIHMKDYHTVDYTDPHSAEAVTVEGFFGAPVRMRLNPLPSASVMEELPADQRMQITYVTERYAYLTYNGQEGYVFISDFVPMDYQKGSTEPYTVYSDEIVKAYASPYYGAVEKATIAADTPITVTGFDGDHLLADVAGETLYVDKDEVTKLLDDFAVEPFTAGVKAKVTVLSHPLKNAEKIGTVKKDAEVTVEGYQGAYVHVKADDLTGYIPADQLKSSSETKAAKSAFNHYLKSIAGRKFLDVALSMMEEGNPILRMYNEYCEGEVTARYQYGVPYLFAGSKESTILKVRYPSQNSNYYFTDKKYLGGFDCIGFARWLHNQVGMRKLPAISEMPKQNKQYIVSVKGKSMEEWADEMQVGDAIGMGYKSGGYHVMVYIGTLGSFGYTAEMLGETLAPYINYPLVIHCGMNNYHTAWYTQYMQDAGIEGVVPPDGGVTISIVGAPYDACPYTETMWEGTKNVKTFHWFDLEGYNLTSVDPLASGIKWYTVFRNVEK